MDKIFSALCAAVGVFVPYVDYYRNSLPTLIYLIFIVSYLTLVIVVVFD